MIEFLGSKGLIDAEGFQKALYMIDIGQNDLAQLFSKNLSLTQITKKIPSITTEIKNAVKVSLVSWQKHKT